MNDDLYHHQRRTGGMEPPAATTEPQLLHFGDPKVEFEAARSAVAVFDLSDRTCLDVSGPARARFLHAYCTNDVESLQPGQGAEAFVSSLKGRILDHVWLSLDDETIRLDTGPGRADSLQAHLGKYAMLEDVEIADRTAAFAKLLLSGPAAVSLLGLDDLPLLGVRTIDTFGEPVRVQRNDFLGSPGFLLWIPVEQAVGVWNAVTFQDAVPAGRVAYEALRIEAGLPNYGVDLSDEHIAQEAARTDRAISFTKGCYLGQEPIHRLFAMGHTNRELRVLEVDGHDIPETGAELHDGEKTVGTLTSVAVSPFDDRVVALAVVRVASGTVGHELQVDGQTARIVPPFRGGTAAPTES